MKLRSNSSRSLRVSAAVCAVVGLTLLGAATTAAGAASPCGDHSFGFEGTRLLNDGISNSAGPFTISLPAGTYDIAMHSHDAHDEHPGQIEQTMEQWYFVLDSGYVSPMTVDVPDDLNDSDTFAAAQVIGDSTTITLHHRGEGNTNSVDPTCVGFTIVEPATPEPVVEAPTTTTTTPEISVVTEEPVEETPVVAAPSTTEAIPPVVAGVVETAPPVKAQVAAPAPQLALTGPSSLTLAMTFAGLAMLVIGAALVLDERRVAGRSN